MAKTLNEIRTSFLDYFDYNKVDAIELLKNKYDFKPYPYKHYESVFTRFYQGYILPNKFNRGKKNSRLRYFFKWNK